MVQATRHRAPAGRPTRARQVCAPPPAPLEPFDLPMARPASSLTEPSAASPASVPMPESRSGTAADALRQGFLEHIRYSRGKNPETSTAHDRFVALSLAVRDRMANHWVKTSSFCRLIA